MYRLLRTVLLLSLLLSAMVLIGCGGGNSLTGSGPGLGNGSNNAMLQGQYAFAISGQNTNGAPFFAVGSFTADGQGHLGGNEDVINGTLQSGPSGAHFGGTYAVGADGRGNAVLGLQPGCPNWQFTMLSHAHALLTCLNTNITGSGTIDLQDPSAFSTAALKGNYVFSASGVGISGLLAVAAGSWTTNGAGNLSGQMDVNDAGSLFQDIATSGTYSVGSNGRGTVTISSRYFSTPQSFVFYVVNSGDFKFLENDAAAALSGEAFAQAPALTTASFNGTYAFTLGGIDGNGSALALGGLMAIDGSGNIASGTLDANDNGSTSIGNAVTGTYSVSNGRGTATLNASIGSIPMAFYKAANGSVEIVNLGGTIGSLAFVAGGMAKAQAGAPFSSHSISGNYAVNLSGTNLGSAFTGAGEEDISGQLIGNGAGNLSGVLDINNFGAIFQGVSLATSSYSMTANGYGTASMNAGTGTFALQGYQIDPNTVLFLDVDNNRIMTGIAEKQQF